MRVRPVWAAVLALQQLLLFHRARKTHSHGLGFCKLPERPLRQAAMVEGQEQDAIHVAFASDAANFAGLLVAMMSLARHLKAPGRCRMHLIVPPDDLVRAQALADCFDHEAARHVNGVRVVPEVELHEWRPLPFPLSFYNPPVGLYWTRVFLHEYLPTSAPRVLWLDHDTVIRADITPLYGMHLEHVVAAAIEFVQPHLVRAMTFRDHIRECLHAARYARGFLDAPTFNTGVLLLDLTKWTPGNITRSIMDWAVATDGCFVDQLAINFALRGNVDVLDWRWNARFNGTVATPDECLHEVRVMHWNSYPGPKYWQTAGRGDEHVWRAYLPSQECDALV